jgi:hypothetical protein
MECTGPRFDSSSSSSSFVGRFGSVGSVVVFCEGEIVYLLLMFVDVAAAAAIVLVPLREI